MPILDPQNFKGLGALLVMLLSHLQSSTTPRVKLLSNNFSRTLNEEYNITNTQMKQNIGENICKKGENARLST
jgi:hypothetical protein